MAIAPRLMRVREAARFLGISLRTLEKHRTYGTGPLYRKVGGRVLYSVEDMMAWTAGGARHSPSEATSSRVFPARPLTPEERESL
ncbi:DNA-binding protein [Komagataeibacter saccharivorans]|nr:helix-turn-helix domain-containing protein [Komagataeibacter saccharivorans]PYD49833.1 DNA-binding protein [Komagataeibacter saccharivorans]GBQ37265.1 putative transcriptional regulator [Komagataeibacter saccharivorans NRIC 0614]